MEKPVSWGRWWDVFEGGRGRQAGSERRSFLVKDDLAEDGQGDLFGGFCADGESDRAEDALKLFGGEAAFLEPLEAFGVGAATAERADVACTRV